MDPMILISLVSGLLFAYLGNWMARRRDAHTTLWTLAGFLFPPLLLILKIIQWSPGPRAEDYEVVSDDDADEA
ncbi:MAG: hypothetical protein ACPHGY_10105 [Rhodospirillaceae bacterium]|jgi:hypothetical protein